MPRKKATGGAGSSRSTQREKNRANVPGQLGDMAAFEESMSSPEMLGQVEVAVKNSQTLPDGTYVGIIGDVKAYVKKDIPTVILNITTVTDTNSSDKFEGVPVPVFFKLKNPKDLENNWGLNRYIKALKALGFDEESVREPGGCALAAKALNDEEDLYISFTVSSSPGKGGDVFINYNINGRVDPVTLGLVG